VIVVLAVVAGVAIGRFVTYDEPASRSSSAPSLNQSLASLEARVDADPDDVEAWQALGFAYLQRAVEIGDPSFYDLADRALGRAGELAPGAPEILLGQAALALTLHRFPEALALGQQVSTELPSNTSALAVLVDAQVEMGRYDEAEASLQRMLDLRPSLPALARASYLRELNGDLPGAIMAMTQAEAAGASPYDRANVASLLGTLHFRQGDLDAASGAFGRALQESPGFVGAEVGQAKVLAATGRVEEAIGVLDGVIDRFPTPEAVIVRGDLLTLAGRDAEAAESYALVDAISALQESSGLVVDLEMALFEADRGEDPARALELAEQAAAVRPDAVYVADALAWARLQSGDAAGARAPMEQALRLGTTDALVRYHAAEVFSALGDTGRAASELEQALAGTPWFSFRHHDRVLELAAELGVAAP
jgi:tetratricopeptide (TPR) repeat protein